MNALAKDNVGKFLDTHFVSAFQRVATFRVAGNQKQGGNVASYFCTPDGFVLHAIAGPADESTFLREAHWVVDAYNLALLKNQRGVQQLSAFFRKAHFERMQNELAGWSPSVRFSTAKMTARDWKILVDQNQHRITDPQGKVHLLLIANPLPRLQDIYQTVFEKILNERISTNPVSVAGR